MQTPFSISQYESETVPPSVIAKLKMQSPYYDFSEKSQVLFQGYPSLLKLPKYLLQDFKKSIAQFSLKYLGDDSQEMIQQVLIKGSRLDMEVQGRKGLRQLAAAIVLGEKSAKMRIKIKQYAALNGLYCTTLTKNYIKYKNITKYQKSSNENYSQEMKLIQESFSEQKNCKIQQVTCKLEYTQEENTNIPKKDKVESIIQAIECVYDRIFRSQKMQKNRRQIINKMNQKIYSSIYDIEFHLSPGQKSPSRLFAIVFAFIRSMGISYPLAKYNEGIKFATGHTTTYDEVLKVKTASSFVCKKKNPVNFQVKLQDCSDNFLLINDHLLT